MIHKIIFAATLLMLPATAQAEWMRAESTNFIAYSEGDPAILKNRVADLEKFGHVLQAMTGARRPKEVPVKITVYFVRTIDDVGKTLPYPVSGVAGYYSTTMRGPFHCDAANRRKAAHRNALPHAWPGGQNGAPT